MPTVPAAIERDILIDADLDRVWSVLTQPRHLGTWFSDAGAELDLRPGGELVLRWREHGTVRAVVTAVEPPHRFAFRWAGPLAETPSDGNATEVEFTLVPADGGGTRLTVVERGFRDLALPDDEQATYAEENTEGWTHELEELRRYLAEIPA